MHIPEYLQELPVALVFMLGDTMIDLYILEQFIGFAQYGTLSETADQLHLSQPALSRNMKKLEDDLGVQLFIRSKNKMTLNENGQYFYELADRLLKEAGSIETLIRDYDRRHKMISVGMCAPAPAWKLTPMLAELYPQISIQTEIDSSTHLYSGLEQDTYQLIVVRDKPHSEQYHCVQFWQEHLMFALPAGHKYADRKTLTFAEMNGESILASSNIGFWTNLHKTKMPASRFLIQEDRFSFNQIVEASTLPSFVTDLSARFLASGKNRIKVRIADPEASVTYYLVCKKETRNSFQALFDSLNQ